MRRSVQALSTRVEFGFILVGAFGYFAVKSLLAVFHPSAVPPISEKHLEFLLIYESIALMVLCVFLYWRGWTVMRFGLKPTPKDTLIGLGLWLAVYAAYALVWTVAMAMSLRPSYAGSYQSLTMHNLSVPTAIAISVLNPIFEETFLCGYIVTAAKQAGHTITGINVSVAIRVFCHLYQGSLGVIAIIPLGLIFAWWYARTGRLWPVLIAHAIFDAMALLKFAI